MDDEHAGTVFYRSCRLMGDVFYWRPCVSHLTQTRFFSTELANSSFLESAFGRIWGQCLKKRCFPLWLQRWKNVALWCSDWSSWFGRMGAVSVAIGRLGNCHKHSSIWRYLHSQDLQERQSRSSVFTSKRPFLALDFLSFCLSQQYPQQEK